MSTAIHTPQEPNEAIARLNALREDAEKHLDEAQEALFDDSISDEEALAHLDAALGCVRDMLPQETYEDNSQAA